MLSELFENIKVYGRYVRSNSLNGLDGWANIKQFLSNPGNSIAVQQINTILGTEWNLSVQIETSNISDLDQIYEHVHGSNDGQLHMYGEENDDVSKSLDPDTWSKYHFYLQLVRIPKNNKLDLIRLLQIAYNLGQLSCVIESDKQIYNKQVIDFFETNKLNDISTYIKLTSKQEKEINDNVQINDLMTNLNKHILTQMHMIQTDGADMEPFYTENIEELTKQNNDYRRVLYTGPNQQFVLMSIGANDNIKMEVHKSHDQFIRIEEGKGKAIIGSTEYILNNNSAVIIPAGMSHQIINTDSTNPLKLYTIYSPPEHPVGLVQTTNHDKTNMKGGSKKLNKTDKQSYFENNNNNMVLNSFMSKYY